MVLLVLSIILIVAAIVIKCVLGNTVSAQK